MKKIFFHPQTFNILSHSFPLKQTSFQGPQVENVIMGSMSFCWGLRKVAYKKKAKKKAERKTHN